MFFFVSISSRFETSWNLSCARAALHRERSTFDKTRHSHCCRQSISCGRSDALTRSVQSFACAAEENQRSQVGGEDFATIGTDANDFDTWRHQGYIYANKSNVASHKYQSMGSIRSRKSKYRVVDVGWRLEYYHKLESKSTLRHLI